MTCPTCVFSTFVEAALADCAATRTALSEPRRRFDVSKAAAGRFRHLELLTALAASNDSGKGTPETTTWPKGQVTMPACQHFVQFRCRAVHAGGSGGVEHNVKRKSIVGFLYVTEAPCTNEPLAGSLCTLANAPRERDNSATHKRWRAIPATHICDVFGCQRIRTLFAEEDALNKPLVHGGSGPLSAFHRCFLSTDLEISKWTQGCFNGRWIPTRRLYPRKLHLHTLGLNN